MVLLVLFSNFRCKLIDFRDRGHDGLFCVWTEAWWNNSHNDYIHLAQLSMPKVDSPVCIIRIKKHTPLSLIRSSRLMTDLYTTSLSGVFQWSFPVFIVHDFVCEKPLSTPYASPTTGSKKAVFLVWDVNLWAPREGLLMYIYIYKVKEPLLGENWRILATLQRAQHISGVRIVSQALFREY